MLKTVLPVLTGGLAGCTENISVSSEPEPNTAEDAKNQNRRYGLPPCNEADRLVRVRNVSVDYRGLVQGNYNYLIETTIKASGTEKLAVRIESGRVIGPNSDKITDIRTTQTIEFFTTATNTFQFEANIDTQYDASELSVDLLIVQAMPLDEWEIDDSVSPLSGTKNQGCY